MNTHTLEISDQELLEVTQAYQVLERFLDRIISPNDLYTGEFLSGLAEADSQVLNKEYSEVKDFADFTQ